MSEPTTRPRRRTQEERRAETKRRVLDAAVDVLVEDGYFNLTTGRVADRAGVSRGAQLHQYPTRQELVVAAVEYLANQRASGLREEVTRLPDDADRTAAALAMFWSQFSGRLFQAGIELIIAARTDAVLRAAIAPLERELRRLSRELAAELFGPRAVAHKDFADVVTLVLNAMYGIAIHRLLQPTAAVKRQLVLLERVVRATLSEAAPAAGSDPGP
jgi:AcrR family transcriptional regulator